MNVIYEKRTDQYGYLTLSHRLTERLERAIEDVKISPVKNENEIVGIRVEEKVTDKKWIDRVICQTLLLESKI